MKAMMFWNACNWLNATTKRFDAYTLPKKSL